MAWLTIIAGIALILWFGWEIRSAYKASKEKDKVKRVLKAIAAGLLWFLVDDEHMS